MSDHASEHAILFVSKFRPKAMTKSKTVNLLDSKNVSSIFNEKYLGSEQNKSRARPCCRDTQE